MEKEKDQIQLPDNAFRELKPGEEYEPVMSPGKTYPEVNVWSVTWGIVMAMLFSAAAAYLGLKVGQVFEAAIPIAIIAVGVSTSYRASEPAPAPSWRAPYSRCLPSTSCRRSIPT